MFVGNYDGLQKGYKICQLSKKIALKSIPFSTISGGVTGFEVRHFREMSMTYHNFNLCHWATGILWKSYFGLLSSTYSGRPAFLKALICF